MFDEAAFEASLSAPSSPEPRRKSHHPHEELKNRRSQSFDNLLDVPASEQPLGPYSQESDSAESDEENMLGVPVVEGGVPRAGVEITGKARRNRTELPVASALSVLKGKAGKLFRKVKGHPGSNASTGSEQEESSLKLPASSREKQRDHSPSRPEKFGPPGTKPSSSHGGIPPLETQGRYICI